MIDIRFDKFRLTNIYNITTGTRPESEGLALEAETSAGGHFYVIAFIRWGGDSTYLETIETRFENEIEPHDWNLVRSLIKAGSEIIRAANIKNMEE
jgi:hypothetical protein